MTPNADPLRNIQAHSVYYSKTDFFLGVVQYITFNCGKYFSFTANLLPLKMSVVLPEIYILSWEAFSLLLCVCFFSPAKLQPREKRPLRKAAEKTTNACESVAGVLKRGFPSVTQHPNKQFHLASCSMWMCCTSCTAQHSICVIQIIWNGRVSYITPYRLSLCAQAQMLALH